MMKKIFSIFIMIILIFAMFKIGLFEVEETVKIDKTFRVTENDIEWMVQVSETGEASIQPIGDIPANTIIPEKLEEYTITSIAPYAFSGYKNLKTIEIPDTVLEIGEYAFWDCENLIMITFSQHITTLSSNTFLGCSEDLLDNIFKYHPDLVLE